MLFILICICSLDVVGRFVSIYSAFGSVDRALCVQLARI